VIDVSESIDTIYRQDSRRIFATLVRLLGDLDLAEEAMHDAFAVAVKQWPLDGVPKNPRAWLVSTGRFRAIDGIRRNARFRDKLEDLASQQDDIQRAQAEREGLEVEDDRLRLVFTCCHPALSPDVQVALTLREVCGLTTEEVASAFLVSGTTMAQRIVRGKAKIRAAGIPYQIPSAEDLPDRLDSVLSVIYLVFNEGYSSSSGPTVTRADISAEAIRLGRLLLELLPDAEVMGLLALMLLHESRRTARTTPESDIILLEDQDRTLWNPAYIAEGKALIESALAAPSFGVYTIQAALSAVHADAASAQETEWGQVVALYDILQRAQPSPVVELNRAVAMAMRDGPETGLALIEGILERGELTLYHLAHAARADMYRRLGRSEQAAACYRTALELVSQEPERRFLESRLDELQQLQGEQR
jgi:RNA polymerase sigma-70 factor (ECF subfamily)